MDMYLDYKYLYLTEWTIEPWDKILLIAWILRPAWMQIAMTSNNMRS